MFDAWAEFHVALWLLYAYGAASHARQRWEARAAVTHTLTLGILISLLGRGLDVIAHHTNLNGVFGLCVLMAALERSKAWLDDDSGA